MHDAKAQRHMTSNSEKNLIDETSSRRANSLQDDIEGKILNIFMYKY